jgi:hypothetical protein
MEFHRWSGTNKYLKTLPTINFRSAPDLTAGAGYVFKLGDSFGDGFAVALTVMAFIGMFAIIHNALTKQLGKAAQFKSRLLVALYRSGRALRLERIVAARKAGEVAEFLGAASRRCRRC